MICDRCRWKKNSWAGPCIHPTPENDECSGFWPDKQHNRRKTRDKSPRGGA